MCRSSWLGCGFLLSLACAGVVSAQQSPDTASLLKSERAAMVPLSMMDGVWRGSAWFMTRSGEKYTITQTERVGPFLDGSVKVMEGRGYDMDGSVSFNALGIVSYDPMRKSYSMHSYAQGFAGDFDLKLAPHGFVWEVPAGPATMRYTATIRDGTWHEVGERIVKGKSPVRVFEMKLKRTGDTHWPAANPVPMKP